MFSDLDDRRAEAQTARNRTNEGACGMKIVLLDAETLGHDADFDPLRQYGELEVWQRSSQAEVVERAKHAEIIVLNKVRIGADELHQLPGLKLICITATGTDNVDLEAAERHGVAVTNVAGYSTESVAQHTIAVALALLHRLSYYDSYVKEGEYGRNALFTHIGPAFWEISGKRWGIVGLGEIGRRVAEIATAFGAEVVYYSTSGRNTDQLYRRLDLGELLESARIVSIHAPLNDATRGLITADELRRMGREALLVNVGRGGIVDEAAVAAAVERDEIAGAALDVFAKEPPAADNPLLNSSAPERLLLTPHNAWSSIESRGRLLRSVAENIGAFLAGRNRNRVR